MIGENSENVGLQRLSLEKGVERQIYMESSKKAKYRNTKRMKAEDRKDLILESARTIIIEEGFSLFSSRYVAERCGIRLATLQYYFKTTEDLFRATFDYAIDLESIQVHKLIGEVGSDPEENLRAHLRGHIRANAQHDTAGFFYQLWAKAHLDEFASLLMGEFYTRLCEQLSLLLMEYNSSLTQRDANARAGMIMAFLEGSVMFTSPNSMKCTKKFKFTEKMMVDTVLSLALKEY